MESVFVLSFLKKKEWDTMSSSHKITAASIPLVLGEHEFEASPITDRGWDELDMWLQSEVIRITEEMMRNQLEEAEEDAEKLRITEVYKDLTLPTALKTSLSVSYQSDTGQTIIRTARGLARLAYQLIRKNHPKIKYSEVVAICRGNADTAQFVILQVLLKFHGNEEAPLKNE